MSTRIPSAWKGSVCAILRTADERKIHMVLAARNDWAATFPDEWHQNLYAALIDALSLTDIEGERKEMNEAGETYAFFFMHNNTKLYGKVNLLPDGQVLIIYSAHRPRLGDRL